MKFLLKLLLFKLVIILLIKDVNSESYATSMECLVEAIYFEARSESFSGQLAVATVILNRVKSTIFPNTICKVVKEGIYYEGHPVRHQCSFSYYCDGKPETMRDLDAMFNAEEIAFFVMNGGRLDGLERSLYYHAVYVNPACNKSYQRLMQIDNHIFYGEENE